MKAEIIKPKPVPDAVVITLTRSEAEDLTLLLGKFSVTNVQALIGSISERRAGLLYDRTYYPLYDTLADIL